MNITLNIPTSEVPAVLEHVGEEDKGGRTAAQAITRHFNRLIAGWAADAAYRAVDKSAIEADEAQLEVLQSRIQAAHESRTPLQRQAREDKLAQLGFGTSR